MTTTQVIANVISAFAMLLMFISTQRRDKRRMMIDQTVNAALYLAADLMLRAYSGAAQDAVGLVRNIVIVSGRHSRALSVVFVAAFIVLGVGFNNMGALGLLPVVASVEYAVVVMNPRSSARAIKISLSVSFLFWAVYAFYVGNYVSMVANVINIAAAVFALARDRRRALS